MKFKKLSKNEYIARFESGEEIFGALEKFCRNQKIEFAWIMMFGGLQKSTIAAYSLSRKKYIERKFDKNLELAGATGNIGWMGDKPVLHIHAVLGDQNGRTYGGHLRNGIVGATLEVYVKTFNKKVSRKYFRNPGLNLLDL